MKQYTKPLLLANEDLAEGVYAASGNTSTTVPTEPGNSEWKINGYKIGDDRQSDYSPNPGHYYVNVDLTPGSGDSCTVMLTFNGIVNSAVVGGNSAMSWSLSYSGSTVTATHSGSASGSGFDQLELYVKTQNDNPTCSATVS